LTTAKACSIFVLTWRDAHAVPCFSYASVGFQLAREPDLSVLDSRRGPVPAVPPALLPQPWRGWIGDTERATGAPADYVLQSVLAGVAAVCGAGVVVRVTPAWSEPLVLWLTAVGEPMTGKSAALAPMRRLLDVIEQERQLGDEERRAGHDERSKADGKGSAAVSAPFVPSQVVATDDDPGCTISATSSPISPIATNPAGRPTAGWSIRRWGNLKTGSGNSGTVRNDIFCRIVGACPERSRRIRPASNGARTSKVRLRAFTCALDHERTWRSALR